MFISKKHNIKNVEHIYTDMTRTYLNSIQEVVDKNDLQKFNNSTYLISEGYRHSLCLLLGLETEASTYLVKKYESKFVDVLRPVYNKYNLCQYSMEKRKGILEACIHCIEKSRKLVD